MAFTVVPAPSGKHRRTGRPRRSTVRAGSTLAGVTVLSATGAFAGTAMAAPGEAGVPGGVQSTTLSQALEVTGTLADSLAAQADAQRQAAVDARREAAQARAKAAAVARARAAAAARAKAVRAAEERAARAAERRRLNAFVPPVTGSYISTPYRATSSLWSSGYHTGVDFHAATGTPVHAVGSGTVVEAGWDGSYGNDIVIRMSDGRYTLYGHLSSIQVSVGEQVTPGRRIALSGATGNVTGPHLHFEVRTTPDYGSDIDPVAYLRSHGVNV